MDCDENCATVNPSESTEMCILTGQVVCYANFSTEKSAIWGKGNDGEEKVLNLDPENLFSTSA